MEKLIELLGGIVIIGGLSSIVYFIARYTFLTRKMLAEKGMLEKFSQSRISKLDIAYISVGIGIGLLISAGLSEVGIQEKTLDFLSWGIILIAGAIGLLLAIHQKR